MRLHCDGDATGNGCLEVQGNVVFLGQSGEIDAVLGKQCFVGGDDMLLCCECSLHGALGDAFIAADQFDEHVGRRVGRQFDGIIEPFEAPEINAPAFRPLARGHGDHLQFTPDTLRQSFAVDFQEVQQAPTDGPKARNSQSQWLAHVPTIFA